MSNNHGQSLTGKIAVITGGSSGIGLATATRFVSRPFYRVQGSFHQIRADEVTLRRGFGKTTESSVLRNMERNI